MGDCAKFHVQSQVCRLPKKVETLCFISNEPHPNRMPKHTFHRVQLSPPSEFNVNAMQTMRFVLNSL